MGLAELLQIIFATLGTFGFALVFNIRGKKLFFAVFGGLLAWTLFLVFGFFLPDETLRYFLVSVLLSLYAEMLARLLKTPTLTFSIVSLVPLVPGSGLYYSMTNAFSGNGDAFLTNAVNTLKLAAALSLGIVVVNTTATYIKKHLHIKKQTQK